MALADFDLAKRKSLPALSALDHGNDLSAPARIACAGGNERDLQDFLKIEHHAA
jgi:glucose-6-phosphate 1-dehydrogenase